MKRRWVIAAMLVLAPAAAAAGSGAALEDGAPDDPNAPSYSLSLYLNLVPDKSYLLPMAAMTRGRLYVEARYQYEDLETASLWIGPVIAGGEQFSWWIAPVAGVAFGRTDGLAPGVDVELGWRRLSLSASAEYLFDLGDEDASFFYSWTEWIYNARDLFAPGITLERTRARDTGRGVNAGLTLYSRARGVSLSFYAFNPWDGADDYYVCGIGYEF